MSDGMKNWRERLADVDDDYLIGISNKGTVKRAYKDKEESAAEIQSLGGEAEVKVGQEAVTIRFPLGESKCTCPSRSICRHVVQAVLTLREECAEGEGQTEAGTVQAENQPQEAGAAPTENLAQEAEPAQAENQAQETGATQTRNLSQEAEVTQAKSQPRKTEVTQAKSQPQETPEQPEHLTWKETSAQGDVSLQKGIALQTEASPRPAVSEKVCREIDEYPLTTLKKALGARRFQSFSSQALAGVRPQIQYASVVTVRLPDTEQGVEAVVKLLSPLEYSSCTCHKKELCVHKAAAILWCRLASGTLTEQELAGQAAEELLYDMDRVKEAAGQMKLFLEELFGTGLSRTSPDVLDHMERLAVISHNAGLARFEGYFRTLFDSYDRYFKRKAAFQTTDLMAQITRLYRRVKLLQQAGDSAEVRQYAGGFRAEYLPVGRLELIGIAIEHFNSRAGYEGETAYFLEENTKKWYTYTNARPVFYEKGKRRRFTEKAQAPWRLGISLEELLKVRICLTGAKCDERGRLSASQDTRGEVTGERKLSLSDIEGWYYRDFGKLFAEQIGRRQRQWLAGDSSREEAELVFVQPDSCEPADFSQTGQKLSLPLYDEAGREVIIEVTYSKEESGNIRYLERISEKKLPCFAGKIYLRDGRLRMYPVAVQDEFVDVC